MSDLDDVRRVAEAAVDAPGCLVVVRVRQREASRGACDYTRKRITVSRYLAARYDDETNRQTLLHEVAHALAGRARARRALEAHGADARLHRRHDPPRRDRHRARPVGGRLPGRACRVPPSPGDTRDVVRTMLPAFDDRYLFVWTRREITRRRASPR
jgi:hypothetical protein